MYEEPGGREGEGETGATLQHSNEEREVKFGKVRERDTDSYIDDWKTGVA